MNRAPASIRAACRVTSTGAVAFDPCNDVRAGVGHLTIATGRDYRHVAPTSGSYSGHAEGKLSTSKHMGIFVA